VAEPLLAGFGQWKFGVTRCCEVVDVNGLPIYYGAAVDGGAVDGSCIGGRSFGQVAVECDDTQNGSVDPKYLRIDRVTEPRRTGGESAQNALEICRRGADCAEYLGGGRMLL
jgi:hypothetical protein